jgi:hypothetical protein
MCLAIVRIETRSSILQPGHTGLNISAQLFIYLLCLHSVKWLGGSEQGNGKDILPHNFLGRTEESYEELRSNRHLVRDPNRKPPKYSSKHYQILK